MGFYDTTCLITGVNLRSVDATAVLLRRTADGQYHPLSLGVHGSYDGFGCLDAITADANTAALTTFFSNAFRSGRFLAHDHTHAGDPHWFDPDIAIESLLYLVERTTTYADIFGGQYPPSTVLAGAPIVMAMIARPVWDAVVLTVAPPRSVRRNLIDAFGSGADIATDIYGPHFAGLDTSLRHLAAVADFIASHPPLRWAPPADHHQRYPRGVGRQFSAEQSRHFVDVARSDYRHDRLMQRALDDYVRRVD